MFCCISHNKINDQYLYNWGKYGFHHVLFFYLVLHSFLRVYPSLLLVKELSDITVSSFLEILDINCAAVGGGRRQSSNLS